MSHAAKSTGIVLFTRAPVPGATKTRLIPLLGEAGAAAWHRDMIQVSLREAGSVSDATVELWCAPDDEHPFFDECRQRDGIETFVQKGRDLGDRMAQAFEETLQRYDRVLLAGTDCPQLTAAVYHAARQALDNGNPAVIVPATDGGYVLLGLSSYDPSLFAGIDWGSDTVLQQTRDRFTALGWQWVGLPALADIDTPEDYSGFYGQGRVVAPV